jgi:hypothetical protein
MAFIASLKDKPTVGIAIFVIVIVAIVAINLSRRDAPSGVSSDRWFLDLRTGDLVTAATTQRGIVTLPSGHQAVQAHVYSCGDCDDESERFVAYVSRFDEPPAAEQNDPTRPDAQQGAMPVQLVAIAQDHENLQWVHMRTPQGMWVVGIKARSDCPDTLKECTPD